MNKITNKMNTLKDTTTAGEIVVNTLSEKIMQIVAEAFNLTPNDLKTKRRFRKIVLARQTYHYLAIKYTNLSLTEIGKTTLHNHATVINSKKKTLDYRDTNEEFRKKFYAIKKEIEMTLEYKLAVEYAEEN